MASNETTPDQGKATTGDFLTVSLWRGTEQGAYQSYRVPRRENQSVLDIVTWVQRHLEPGLAYRFACRVGMCGSCAMTVNGQPRWACRTHVAKVAADGRLEIGPLRSLPVIRDLACDMTVFFEKWQRARGRFAPSRSRNDALIAVSPESTERREADAAIECINCAVCYAACDVVAWRPDYLGPAALNRAWSLVNDCRDAAPGAVLSAVSRDGGAFSCHSHGDCAAACPVGLDPTRSIAGLKRQVLGRLGKTRG